MHLFSWLDQRTLVASQLPLAAAFGIVLLGLRRVYPSPRGTNAFAIAFLLWIPATLLMLAQGSLKPIASVAASSLLAILAYILVYRGVLGFFHARGVLPLLYDVGAVTAAVILYFTVIYDLSVPRIVAMSLFIALARAMMAVELYRNANKRTSLLVFASIFAFFALLPLCMAIVSVLPASVGVSGVSFHAELQMFSTIVDMVFLFIVGLFGASMLLGDIGEKIRQQGQLDPVTGTLSQRGIEDALTSEVARSSRTHSPVSVMLIEVDHFKALTGTHGHARGDEALCTVVKTIASILRFYDKCGRLAEDRFLLLLPENVAEHAMVIADRFREALKDPNMPHDQPAITLSIGVTQCAFKEPAIDVLARAELALFEARRLGRNRAYLKLPNHEDVVAVHPDRVANRARVAKLTR